MLKQSIKQQLIKKIRKIQINHQFRAIIMKN